jgi:hypothetical protein
MTDLYNIFLEKNAPDMIRAATVRATMQNVQTLNVVRLKASQMLSASGNKVKMVSRSRFAGLRPTSPCEVGLPGLPARCVSA